MKKVELVFIPSPDVGHLVSTIEFSRRLIAQDPRLSVNILTMNSPFPNSTNTINQYSLSSTPSTQRDPSSPRFISLPQVKPPPMEILRKSMGEYVSTFAASHCHHVRDEIINLQNLSGNPVCMVVDTLCTSMVDVAHELGIPSYVFFTSGAAILGFILHLQDRHNQTSLLKFNETESDVVIPSYQDPIPSFSLPAFSFCESAYTAFMNHGSKFKETKGIVVNTVAELEPHAIKSIGQVLPVYTVGPVLDLDGPAHRPGDQAQQARVMRWLDAQPDSSVVFLCFGSVGAFSETQLREIAVGISQSGQSFLWSIRKKETSGGEIPTEYTESELRSVLPNSLWALVEQGRGMVCGWAAQVKILAHRGVGSFVSHCGWNSTLESVWFGKPIVAWPLYAEQHLNAFQLVSELGLASIQIGLGSKSDDIVLGEEVGSAIKLAMAQNNPTISRVKEMSKLFKQAFMDGGSSFNSIGCFIRSILGEEL